jgi:hypothetical protein
VSSEAGTVSRSIERLPRLTTNLIGFHRPCSIAERPGARQQKEIRFNA